MEQLSKDSPALKQRQPLLCSAIKQQFPKTIMFNPILKSNAATLWAFCYLSLFCSFTTLAGEAHRFDAIANSIIEEQSYPGASIAVFYKGKAYYTGQAGFSDAAAEKAPDHDTMFRMYSLTKGMTQILAAVLVEQGVLDLDAPISDYVPDLPETVRPITSRQLMANKGGIRHYKSNQEWFELSQQHCDTPEDALESFLSDPLIAEPGTKVSYSSFGYVLLSHVLERAAGQPFKQLMQEHIWKRSGVERIEMDDPEHNTITNISTYYEPADDGYLVAPFIDNSCKFGGGAINATPTAMARIFSDFYQAKLTSRKTLESIVPATTKAQETISFGGEGVGGRSALVAYPNDQLVVVVVANARGGEVKSYAEKLARAVYAEF